MQGPPGAFAKISSDDATWFYTDVFEKLLKDIDVHIEYDKSMENMKNAQVLCVRAAPSESQRQQSGSGTPTPTGRVPMTRTSPHTERPVPKTREADNFKLAHDKALRGIEAVIRNLSTTLKECQT